MTDEQDVRIHLQGLLEVFPDDSTAEEVADALLSEFVMIPRDDLPEVRKVESGSFQYVETVGPAGWSYGTHPDEAPSASDPAHLVAIIEWFRKKNLPLHKETK